jgi:hypothetical protein
MNLMAFSLLANSNPQVDEIQIPFGTVDFQPHQSSFTQAFESMDQDMDLMIGSLNCRIGLLGLIRLSDPTKLDPLASEPKTVAMSESSEGSSSEVNLDGFRVARTRGTTRRTQGFERRGLNVGDLGSQQNTVMEASSVERATHCRERDRALPRFRALVVR